LQKETTSIAGWKGGQKSIDEILRIEYLLHYIIEHHRTSSATKSEITTDLFRILRITLESGILPALLTNNRPLLLQHINRLSDVGERSTRRQLRLLEDFGVIDRIKHAGQKGINLRTSWRVMLKHIVSDHQFQIAIPINLLQRTFRLVQDSVLYDWLASEHTTRESWATIERLKQNHPE